MNSDGGCYLVLLWLLVLKDSVSQKIMKDHTYQAAVVGCNARLVWNLNGQNYKPSVFKKSQQLYNNRKYYIDSRSQVDNVTLTIRNVTFDDGGIYRCLIDSTDDDETIHLNVTDFQWRNEIQTKAVSVGDTVNVVWNYSCKIKAHNIWIYRQNGTMRDLVAGKQNTTEAISKRMALYHTNGVDETHTVNFTVRNITIGDLKFKYIIKLQFGDDCFKYEESVKLKEKQRIHIYSETTIIKALPQDDVSFIWYYEYKYPVLKILFTRYQTANQIDRVGYWADGEFESTISEDKIKLILNKTEQNITNGIKGQINLTLFNAAIEDFDYIYICQMTFSDLRQSSWNIYLEEKPPMRTNVSTLDPTEVAGITVSVLCTVVLAVAVILLLLVKRRTISYQRFGINRGLTEICVGRARCLSYGTVDSEDMDRQNEHVEYDEIKEIEEQRRPKPIIAHKESNGERCSGLYYDEDTDETADVSRPRIMNDRKLERLIKERLTETPQENGSYKKQDIVIDNKKAPKRGPMVGDHLRSIEKTKLKLFVGINDPQPICDYLTDEGILLPEDKHAIDMTDSPIETIKLPNIALKDLAKMIEEGGLENDKSINDMDEDIKRLEKINQSEPVLSNIQDAINQSEQVASIRQDNVNQSKPMIPKIQDEIDQSEPVVSIRHNKINQSKPMIPNTQDEINQLESVVYNVKNEINQPESVVSIIQDDTNQSEPTMPKIQDEISQSEPMIPNTQDGINQLESVVYNKQDEVNQSELDTDDIMLTNKTPDECEWPDEEKKDVIIEEHTDFIIKQLEKHVESGNMDQIETLLNQLKPGDIRRLSCDFIKLTKIAIVKRNLSLLQYLFTKCLPLLYDINWGLKLITCAIKHDFVEGVKYLYSQGLSLQIQHEGKLWSALTESVRFNSLNTIKYLVSITDTDINVINGDGYTPLICAIEYHRDNIDACKNLVSLLIEHGADINQMGCLYTPLAYAIEYDLENIDKCIQLITLLIKHGADVNIMFGDGFTPLTYVLETHSDIDTCIKLLSLLIKHGAKTTRMGEDSFTPLTCAIRYHRDDNIDTYKQLILFLIEHGADVNGMGMYGCTPLTYILETHFDNIDTCKKLISLLIKHGADINRMDRDGHTPLTYAIRYHGDNIDIYKTLMLFLIEHGADVNGMEKGSYTPLKCAIRYHGDDRYTCINLISFLINQGADIRKKSISDMTPLMLAAQYATHPDIVKLVLGDEDNVNCIDDGGLSACRYCFQTRDNLFSTKRDYRTTLAIFQLLVESGANIVRNGVKLLYDILTFNNVQIFEYYMGLESPVADVTDQTNENIFHLLAQVKYDFTFDKFKWLFDYGLDINHRDSKSNTPVITAGLSLNNSCLQLLINQDRVCDVNIQNNLGQTALHAAVIGCSKFRSYASTQNTSKEYKHQDLKSTGELKQMRKMKYIEFKKCVDILRNGNVGVNVQDSNGTTALMLAAANNDKEMAKILLDTGADLHILDNNHGSSALQFIDVGCGRKCLKLFITQGGHTLINLPGTNGNTLIQRALLFAIYSKPHETICVIRLLVAENCCLQKLKSTETSYYNDLTLDVLDSEARHDLRQLLYRSGAPAAEIVSTINCEKEDSDATVEHQLHSPNRDKFNLFCFNLSLKDKCVRIIRQNIGLDVNKKVEQLGVPSMVKSRILLVDYIHKSYFRDNYSDGSDDMFDSGDEDGCMYYDQHICHRKEIDDDKVSHGIVDTNDDDIYNYEYYKMDAK